MLTKLETYMERSNIYATVGACHGMKLTFKSSMGSIISGTEEESGAAGWERVRKRNGGARKNEGARRQTNNKANDCVSSRNH
jgi:hypothetical protein